MAAELDNEPQAVAHGRTTRCANDPLWNTRAACGFEARAVARPLIDPLTRSGEFLGLPDDKVLSCRLDHLFGHRRQGVDFENPLDLCQEAIQ